MRNFQAIQNKEYSWQNSIKVNDAMRTKAESGWFPSNHVPLGYTTERLKNESGRDRKRGAIVVPDRLNPDKIRQVIREHELRADGLSFDEIRKQIIAEGFISADNIKGYSKGSIEYRLKNSFYDGYFEWQGIAYKGNHELIIRPELRDKVKATFGVRGRSPKAQYSTAIFGGGWLRCTCGCHIVFDPKFKTIKATGEKKTFAYYHCTNGKRAHSSLSGMSTTEEHIWQQFERALDAIAISEEIAREIATTLNLTQDKAQQAHKNEIAAFNSALALLDKKQDRIFDLLMDGHLEKQDYQRQLQRLKDERNELTAQLERAQLAVTNACMETAKSVLELAKNAKSLWLSRPALERRSILDEILSNPVLDGKTIRYEMKKPFAILTRMASSQEWWG